MAPVLSYAGSACSSVSIEIPQQLTLERIAFDAKMVITNNMPDRDLNNVNVDIIVKDSNGNIKTGLFFVKLSSNQNISAVDGTGTVAAGTQAEIHWLIIPSPGAGGTTADGQQYWVGATLTYTVDGNQEVVPVNPASITVKPDAQLILDYFLPYEVIGDNPFTPQVEPSVPFPLAVRVFNDGYGAANDLKIDSAQPQIVDNSQGLLVNFQLLGASVDDSPVTPSLEVDMGDLPSKKIATAYWEMTSSLSGKFVDFNASFTHSSDLGGTLTSLIEQTNSYYLIHRVRDNLPGRDQLLDYLVDTTKSAAHIPNAIFESEVVGSGQDYQDSIVPVSLENVTSAPPMPTPQAPNVPMQISTDTAGWVYARTADPAEGMLKLQDVERADGVHLDPNNFWISEDLDSNYQPYYNVNILDYRADTSAPGSYTLFYQQPIQDTTPPQTTLTFNGPYKGTDPVFITPETTVIFNAVDEEGGSGVAQTYKKLLGTDADFVVAAPFNSNTPGPATLLYYSTDRAGNQENIETTNLYVVSTPPVINSFTVSPSSFSPQAPEGMNAARTVVIDVNATSSVGAMQGDIQIASGGVFSSANVIKTFAIQVVPGTDTTVQWDGTDMNGSTVPVGSYTARLVLSDGLDSQTTSHTATTDVNITVAPWFNSGPIDSDPQATQLNPRVLGTVVVWQDNRNGNWDIYMKDVSAGGQSVQVTSSTADQENPAIDGNIIVWQDNRNGNWDIYGYNIQTNTEFPICTDTGDQINPRISGQWVVWQGNSAGKWNIYAYNLSTKQQQQITSSDRDQINPDVSGNTVVWEDYRNGPAAIYKYDLSAGTEARVTYDSSNQTFPSISGTDITWTDDRNVQKDIYSIGASGVESRLTYGAWDHTQSFILNGVTTYTDYEAGPNNPDVSFYDLKTGVGAIIVNGPAQHEGPVLGAGIVAWQDNRSGVYQIYWAPFTSEASTVEVDLKPGFNLIAAGSKLAAAYPSASALISSGLGITKVVTYNGLNGVYLETSPSADITIAQGMGLGVYASKEVSLAVADSSESATYSLYAGLNYVGMLSTPPGYHAYDLINSVGLGNIQSVRRFNSVTGSWETAAVRTVQGTPQIDGVNFPIFPGEGLIITMTNQVNGWKP